ncbi:carboxymuconolactone decarboxylase family protein [Kitasatospora sp. NPDC093558]|uniref:carboxymuconolactone decarboxylase family protein n=1 Tax=Kitasatospora sp. NPDC093558 TaxID=3155201 RepID=UPI0034495BE3
MSTEQHSTRFARGLAQLAELGGDRAQQIAEPLQETAPDLGRFLVEFAYGDINSRPGLDLQQRQLVKLGALTALGDTRTQLGFEIANALHVGLTPAQVVEALAHLELVVGFPRSLNAVETARLTFAELGVKAEPYQVEPAAEEDRYARGSDVLREVAGDHGFAVIDALDDIIPDLGKVLVEYAWGEVYSRPGLDYPQRQLITLGAMIAYGDTFKQQKTHLNIALRQGLTPRQLVEVLLQASPFVGFPRTLNSLAALREVFADKDITL